jgi:hypothetical protein
VSPPRRGDKRHLDEVTTTTIIIIIIIIIANKKTGWCNIPSVDCCPFGAAPLGCP